MTIDILSFEPVAWWLRGGVVMAGVWLGAFVLRRFSPVVRASLWRAAMLGLLATVVLVFSGWRWRTASLEPTAGAEVMAVRDATADALGGVSVPAPDFGVVAEVVVDGEVVDAVRGGLRRPAANESRWWMKLTDDGLGWMVPRSGVLWWVWGAGALAVLLRWMVSLVNRWRMAATATALDGDAEWVGLLREVAGQSARVRLLQHASVPVPCAWGCWRPTILLPAGADEWSRDDRKMVLAHEWTHLERWDPFWHVVSVVVLAFHWANPLVWMALPRWRLAEEEAADDAALRHAAPDRYALLLVECARRVPSPRPVPSTAVAMAHPSTVPQRVRRILDPSLNRRRPGAAVLMIIGTVVASLALAAAMATPGLVAQEVQVVGDGENAGPVTAPPAPIPTPSGPAKEPTIQQKLSEIVVPRVTMIDATIGEAVEFLRAKSRELDTATTDENQRGINFILQLAPSDPRSKITIDLRQIPMRVAVEAICQTAGYTARVEDHAVVITSTSQGTEYLTRVFRVHPGFMVHLAGGSQDPGLLTPMPTVVELLKQAGVPFPDGTTAFFSSATSTLTVRNTPAALDLVEQVIESLRARLPRMISVRLVMYRLPKKAGLKVAESLDAELDATAAVEKLLDQASTDPSVELLAVQGLHTRSGNLARVQSGRGRQNKGTVVPTKEPPSPGPGGVTNAEGSAGSAASTALGGNFEGCILEVEPTLGADNVTIDLTAVVTLVEPDDEGSQRPRVASLSTSTTLLAGQTRLLGALSVGTLSAGGADETMTLVFLKADTVAQ